VKDSALARHKTPRKIKAASICQLTFELTYIFVIIEPIVVLPKQNVHFAQSVY
jgi:hypothetical protein